jgi:hypothetical protein
MSCLDSYLNIVIRFLNFDENFLVEILSFYLFLYIMKEKKLYINKNIN